MSAPSASCLDRPTPIMGSPAAAIPGAAFRELPRILFSRTPVAVIGRPHLPLGSCHINRVSVIDEFVSYCQCSSGMCTHVWRFCAGFKQLLGSNIREGAFFLKRTA